MKKFYYNYRPSFVFFLLLLVTVLGVTVLLILKGKHWVEFLFTGIIILLWVEAGSFLFFPRVVVSNVKISEFITEIIIYCDGRVIHLPPNHTQPTIPWFLHQSFQVCRRGLHTIYIVAADGKLLYKGEANTYQNRVCQAQLTAASET